MRLSFCIGLLCAGCGEAPPEIAADAASETAVQDAAAEDRAAERPAAAGPEHDSDRLLDKTFDDLVFDIEPDEPFERSMITPEVEALAGRRVRLRGYIYPTMQKHHLKQFVLVRDNQECCFGPGAALYDCVLVEMAPGKTASYGIRPVAVEGRLRIEPLTFDGKTLGVFQMIADSVD
ncbi:hypothetical protein Mal64_12150 [Pseudobythopirellula maris]|uniref:DUF3299 domain-containing protein n=1 Tax=Pseudobythopirellula maris TaxID=2527991 RepID=A0A5C5ZUW6_9BACT|nr:DUF3299 domain-containing protein [Pseudobythopirellula maris]TWT90818.1 hypothetical protein Mal64_12150 [Pseudobythopirellula maris]